MPAPKFNYTVSLVTVAHALVIGLLIVAGANSCVNRKIQPPILPVEILVAVDDGPEVHEPIKPADAPADIKPPPPPPPTPPIPDPPPAEVVPEEIKKPDPPKKTPEPPKKTPEPPKKTPEPPKDPPKKIELGRRINMTAPNPNPPPPGKRLSPEEIQRRLALGGTPSNRDLMPEGDPLNFEIIRRQLYKAWAQPGSVPSQVKAEVEIRMNPSGTILSRRMLRTSGNAVMDRSVMDAVQSVFRIDGLTPGFVERKGGRVTIIFELNTGTG